MSSEQQSVSLDDLLHCLDCNKPVNVAKGRTRPLFACPCGKTIPVDRLDPEHIDIDPAAPDAWSYGDPDE